MLEKSPSNFGRMDGIWWVTRMTMVSSRGRGGGSFFSGRLLCGWVYVAVVSGPRGGVCRLRNSEFAVYMWMYSLVWVELIWRSLVNRPWRNSGAGSGDPCKCSRRALNFEGR